MTDQPNSIRRVSEKGIGSMYYSNAMWKKIDEGKVNERDVSNTMARALDIMWPDTATHYIHRAVLDHGSVSGARELGLANAIEALRSIIEQAPDTFDGNTGRPMHAGGETILEKAFSFRHDKVFWRGLSFVPLFELLEQHGTAFDEYMFTRTDRANNQYVIRPPISILSQTLEPGEMGFLLSRIPSVSPGVLCHQLATARTNVKRSPHVIDTVKTALEHGVSMIETCPDYRRSPLDWIDDIVFQNMNSRSNLNPEPKESRSLELARILETLLEERNASAIHLYADFTHTPTPDILTPSNMCLLANIDRLDSALSTVQCSKAEAKQVLENVKELDPFLRDHMPIAIYRLERIAGEHVITGADHKGKVGNAATRAQGGGAA